MVMEMEEEGERREGDGHFDAMGEEMDVGLLILCPKACPSVHPSIFCMEGNLSTETTI